MPRHGQCTHLVKSGRQCGPGRQEHGTLLPAEPWAMTGRDAWSPMWKGLGQYEGGVPDGAWVAKEQKDVLE